MVDTGLSPCRSRCPSSQPRAVIEIGKLGDGLLVDGVTWIPTRDAAELINATASTIYKQAKDGVIRKRLVGKSMLLVSKEDTLEYGKSKKKFYARFKTSNRKTRAGC